MPECIKCGGYAARFRRGLLVKLFSKASFRCDECGARFHYYRPLLNIFERYVQCPLCCNRELSVRQSVDRIDRISANPLRRLLFGFPLYHCTFCRYQFRDWRTLHPERNHRVRSAAAATEQALD